MKNHRYSTAGKIATVIIQQLMAVLLVVFLLLLGSCLLYTSDAADEL